MIKVIITDDHALFRMGIRGVLESKCSGICVAGEAGSAESLFGLLETTRADLILLDLILPDMNGIEVAKRLRKEYPHLKILVISSENTANIVIQLLRVGIDGFISKLQATEKELSEAIYSIMNGMDYFGKDISAIIYNIYVAKKTKTKIIYEFTPREQEIINMAGSGLKSREIANQLEISFRTVDAHKNNIFKKLGINNTIELVQYALKEKIIG
ncbi:MAG: response regulator transcription factor [Lentimicrobiaceae bacterium]|nr:response regulator transcription factor [Lentimicrobiaceae bacterium]